LGSDSVFPWYGIYSLNLVRLLRKNFCILNYGQISACGQSVLGNKDNLWLKSLSGDLTGSRRLQERQDLTIAPGRSSMKTGQVLLLDTFPPLLCKWYSHVSFFLTLISKVQNTNTYIHSIDCI